LFIMPAPVVLSKLTSGPRIACVVCVVGDGLDVLVRVRIEVLPGLPLVTSAGDDVVEMRNDARRDEPLAMLVVI
jgi:hypothetical protein